MQNLGGEPAQGFDNWEVSRGHREAELTNPRAVGERSYLAFI